jgi:MYXO-CTERM domain-containing protein
MSKAHTVVGSPAQVALGLPPALVGRLAFLLVAVLCFIAVPASAASVTWKRSKLEELGGAWKLNVDIRLDRAPDVPHVPVRFTFTPTVYFERALVDGKKDPIIREVPLEHQTPVVVSQDVGFLDPSSGKAVSGTHFSFEITRDSGFEAGKYTVKVTDARNGKDFNGGTTLTLDGDNQVVDRRSMVFDSKKEEKPGKSAAAPAEEKKELTPEDDAFWAGGPKHGDEKQAPLPPPASMQQKPGCGCRLYERSSDAAAFPLAALLGFALLRRRRSRRAA